MTEITRRRFLEKALFAVFSPLAFKSLWSNKNLSSISSENADEYGYGPLVPDPKGVIDLPQGFSYKVISRKGERMIDGFYVPALPDGMAAFPGPQGLTIILRNHEIFAGYPDSMGAFGYKNRLMERLRRTQIYDRGRRGGTALGAVTTLVFDTRSQELKSQFLSLAGTVANCSGGSTPWNTWITCEEEFLRAGLQYGKDHGYAFEVSVSAEPKITEPIPLKAMGRFVHEGVAVDLQTGIVYQTEDQEDSLIYRFIPDQPGNLSQGGKLQCLAIKGKPGFDTRNWDRQRIFQGDVLPVHWLELEDVDTDRNDLRIRGYKLGAARFGSGEGINYSNGLVYFDCTNGGPRANGQIWRYKPSPFEGTDQEKDSPGQLELFFEPDDARIMEHPDQLTVAPWGDLLICEDGEGDQFMLGITDKKNIYRFARSAVRESELAGVCFSPDLSTMFLNNHAIGLTLAITGPWKK